MIIYISHNENNYSSDLGIALYNYIGLNLLFHMQELIQLFMNLLLMMVVIDSTHIFKNLWNYLGTNLYLQSSVTLLLVHTPTWRVCVCWRVALAALMFWLCVTK